MLIRGAEIWPGPKVRMDLRCNGGIITAMAERLEVVAGEAVVEANGCALLPGLCDHHLHLLALAAAESSVVCGPPQVTTLAELSDALRKNNETGWLRGIGYHESVAGELGKEQLDYILPDRPLRIQHRTGQLWIFNSKAMEELQLQEDRLYRGDEWLRERLGSCAMPALAAISCTLARYGVTAITDASPGNNAESLSHFCRAVESGDLLQRVQLLGGVDLPESGHSRISTGGVKLLLDEARLPEFDRFVTLIANAHRAQRPVAIHAVTRTELVFALSALREAGPMVGDRIEHASITPDELLPQMRELGVIVVTQPGFVLERGDQYLRDVELADQPFLYRLRAFLETGIALRGSSDAPYGNPDPWRAISAAVNRKTATGKLLGEREQLTPEEALALFLVKPGITVGDSADLCLLNRPWESARTRLVSEDVAATFIAGRVVP